MKNFAKFLLLSAIGFWLVPTANAVELTGVVKSEDGKPLSGVQILTYAPLEDKVEFLGLPMSVKRRETATGANGFFKLPGHGRIVYFKRHDLRPVSMILDLSATHLDVKMENGARSLWEIPSCSSIPDKSKRVGVGFMVTVPDNILVKKDDGRFEEGGYLFGYKNGEQVEVLINWWESTSLEPEEKYLLESHEFSERMWMSGTKSGYEFRGVKSDGKLWRRVSLKNGAIAYQANTKEAAKFFDMMIDTMCFDESAVKW